MQDELHEKGLALYLRALFKTLSQGISNSNNAWLSTQITCLPNVVPAFLKVFFSLNKKTIISIPASGIILGLQADSCTYQCTRREITVCDEALEVHPVKLKLLIQSVIYFYSFLSDYTSEMFCEFQHICFPPRPSVIIWAASSVSHYTFVFISSLVSCCQKGNWVAK